MIRHQEDNRGHIIRLQGTHYVQQRFAEHADFDVEKFVMKSLVQDLAKELVRTLPIECFKGPQEHLDPGGYFRWSIDVALLVGTPPLGVPSYPIRWYFVGES